MSVHFQDNLTRQHEKIASVSLQIQDNLCVGYVRDLVSCAPALRLVRLRMGE